MELWIFEEAITTEQQNNDNKKKSENRVQME